MVKYTHIVCSIACYDKISFNSSSNFVSSLVLLNQFCFLIFFIFISVKNMKTAFKTFCEVLISCCAIWKTILGNLRDLKFLHAILIITIISTNILGILWDSEFIYLFEIKYKLMKTSQIEISNIGSQNPRISDKYLFWEKWLSFEYVQKKNLKSPPKHSVSCYFWQIARVTILKEHASTCLHRKISRKISDFPNKKKIPQTEFLKTHFPFFNHLALSKNISLWNSTGFFRMPWVCENAGKICIKHLFSFPFCLLCFGSSFLVQRHIIMIRLYLYIWNETVNSDGSFIQSVMCCNGWNFQKLSFNAFA